MDKQLHQEIKNQWVKAQLSYETITRISKILGMPVLRHYDKAINTTLDRLTEEEE